MDGEKDFAIFLKNNGDLIKSFLSGPIEKILEIGSHKGGSTRFFLQKLLSDTGTITCIDPFEVSDSTPFSLAHIDGDAEIEKQFWINVNDARLPGQNVILHKGRSYIKLPELIVDRQQFDLVYIDGNHAANNVISDACMAFGMLKPGGILLFDDYAWKDTTGLKGLRLDLLDRPKIAVDFFTTLFARNVEVLFINYQYALKKWND